VKGLVVAVQENGAAAARDPAEFGNVIEIWKSLCQINYWKWDKEVSGGLARVGCVLHHIK
jgi:hypothetical protein